MQNKKKVLISGGGIAGLTLGILLKEKGWDPLIVERDKAMRAEGYMMDFFGTGWDVAERMNLTKELRAVHYPIDNMEYVDKNGHPYLQFPIKNIKKAVDGKYTYLRRSDLERILYERALKVKVPIHFDTYIQSIKETPDQVEVKFANGSSGHFDLVIGADGVHSNVRELVFGPEKQFAKFLGYYVAALHIPAHQYPHHRAMQLYETPDRIAGFYPLSQTAMDATYIFRHAEVGHLSPAERMALVRKKFHGAGWITEQVLQEHDAKEPIFFDSLTQIIMPHWSKGRTALIGDACGCLTLLAGQGSHMGMADAYVLAYELEKHPDNYRAAFESYEKFLKPHIDRKQKEAIKLSKNFVPSLRSNTFLRRLVIKLMFSKFFLKLSTRLMGSKSILNKYP